MPAVRPLTTGSHMPALNRHTDPLTNLPNLGALRAMRARTRARFRDPRPRIVPEIRTRAGHYKALIEAAQRAGYISKSAHHYATALLAIPSVQRGDWCLYSDPQMAERLNCSDRTVRRHRKELVDAGLLESIDGAARHQTCMVRPMLPDGAVFVLPKTPIITATSGRPVRPILADDLLLSEPKKESGTDEVEEQQASQGQGIGPALVAPDAIPETTPPTPPLPPERKRLPNGEVSAAPHPVTSPVWVLAESQAGMAWLRYWKLNRMLGCAVGKRGYFIVPLVSEFPPDDPVSLANDPIRYCNSG